MKEDLVDLQQSQPLADPLGIRDGGVGHAGQGQAVVQHRPARREAHGPMAVLLWRAHKDPWPGTTAGLPADGVVSIFAE